MLTNFEHAARNKNITLLVGQSFYRFPFSFSILSRNEVLDGLQKIYEAGKIEDINF